MIEILRHTNFSTPKEFYNNTNIEERLFLSKAVTEWNKEKWGDLDS